MSTNKQLDWSAIDWTGAKSVRETAAEKTAEKIAADRAKADREGKKICIGVGAVVLLIAGLWLAASIEQTSKPPITAEQAFAANFNNRPLNRMVFNVGPFTGIDVAKLSSAELDRYQTMRHAGELTDLLLYYDRCVPTQAGMVPAGSERIRYQVNQLPEKMRTEMKSREVSAIEATPSFDSKWGDHIPGGWTWFCSNMKDGIKANLYDDIAK